ncbi:MAG: PqqD family protein [Candidatus Zipacnadales bacterium]
MARHKPDPTLPAELSGDATVYEKIIGKFRKPRLSREHALEARPIRNPALKWEKLDNGEVQIILPRRKDAVGKLLSTLFYIPETRPVNLDIVGAKIWQLADGEHTVADMVEALIEEHKLHRREAEVSLTEFLKMLGKRNMVAFIIPSEYLNSARSEKVEAERAKRQRSEKKRRQRKR